MIALHPRKSKTLVLALTAEDVEDRVRNITAPNGDRSSPPVPLMGWVKELDFQVTFKARRTNAFVPVAIGRIEPTSTGCILFLEYKLMPSTRSYLNFWNIISVVSGVCTAIFVRDFLLSLSFLGIIFLINGTAWANFRLHQKPLDDALLMALE